MCDCALVETGDWTRENGNSRTAAGRRSASRARNGSRAAIPFAVFLLVLWPLHAAGVDWSVFEQAYSDVEENMISSDGEVAEVNDFTYQKDAASFSFSKGKFLLRRPVLGRPSVAIFIGEGSVSIDVPTHLERQRLYAMTGDSTVRVKFDICHLRFADDLDAELKERFTFVPGELNSKEFQRVKSFQGDFFFKPIPQHRTDNYFQLVNSALNRNEKGFFWASFGRYVFSFDPDRPDEVEILFNREPTSIVAFPGAAFPREERCGKPEPVWPEVFYTDHRVGQTTDLSLGGIDGRVIISGQSTLSISQDRDSAQHLSLYLDNILEIDSAAIDGQILPFHRRRNFYHVGFLSPRWLHAGDTAAVTLWYHGRDYFKAFPWIENPRSFPHTLNLTSPREFSYIVPGRAAPRREDSIRQWVEIPADESNAVPFFFAYGLGYDTVSFQTGRHMPVHIMSYRSDPWDIWEQEGRKDTLIEALDYLYDHLGPPPGVSDIFVLPWRLPWNHAGVLFPDYIVHKDLGGFTSAIERGVVAQWLSSTAEVRSYRESWLLESVKAYLQLMLIETVNGPVTMFSVLGANRETTRGVIERGNDVPLAGGAPGLSAKGAWVIHMIRNLMNAVDSTREETFNSWLAALVNELNQGSLSNAGFQELTERYFGYDMGWFFRKWLQETGIPKYHVEYATSQDVDGYYLDMNVVTQGVAEDFMMPVILWIDKPSGAIYTTCFIVAKVRDYHLGPYDTEPSEMHFNRSCSVLSDDKVTRKR